MAVVKSTFIENETVFYIPGYNYKKTYICTAKPVNT